MEPFGTNRAQSSFNPRGFPRERRSARQRVHLPAYANLDGNSNGMAFDLSEILDISEHGIGIQAPLPLTVNSTVSIGLDLPKTKSYIQTSGRVVWSDRLGKAGLCFPEMSRVSSQRLKEWLLTNAVAANSENELMTPAAWPTDEDDLLCELDPAEGVAKDFEIVASQAKDETRTPPQMAENDPSGSQNKIPNTSRIADYPSKPSLPVMQDYSSILAGLRDVKQHAQTPGTNFDKFLQMAVERARSLTQASGAAIALRPSDGQPAPDDVLICYASSGGDAPDLGARLKVGSGFSGECVSTGRLLRCDDSETDERVDRESCRRLGIRSMVAAPIKSSGSVIGILEVFSPRQSAFGESENITLQSLSELVASAVNRRESPAALTENLPGQAMVGIGSHQTDESDMRAGYISRATYTPPNIREQMAGLHSKSRRNVFVAGAVVLGIIFIALFIFTMRGGRQAEAPSEAPGSQTESQAAASRGASASTLGGLRKLAQQGDATAQFALGARYAIGEGVKQNYSEALRWFSKAAEQGHVTSQATLGAYYWAGRGVPQDLSKAYFWALLAEAGGDQGSRYRLPVLASRMSRIQIATAKLQADAWMKKSHDPSVAKRVPSIKNDAIARTEPNRRRKEATPTGTPPETLDRQSETEPSAAPSLSDLGVETNPEKLAGIVSPDPVFLPPSPNAEVVRVSQGGAQPLLIKRVQPTYPRQAIQARREGSVQLQATISREGKVSSVKTLVGDPLLARAAVDAVRQWQYKPYFLNGQPTEMETQVTVNFKLP